MLPNTGNNNKESESETTVDSKSNINLEETESSAESETETQRKLFIGGLSWQTTEESLKEYFEGLGYQIEKVIIMKDKATGRSRGFGFITLVNLDDVEKVVSAKLFLGRKIEAKRAIPKQDLDNSSRKFFVGGIPVNLSVNEFRKYFEKFGTVIDAQIITERNSGHSRGFGFVTFESDEVANSLLSSQHVIQGKKVEIKKAQPKKIESVQPIFVPSYPMPFSECYPAVYTPVFSPVFYPPFAVPYIVPQGGFIYAPYVGEPVPVQTTTVRHSTTTRKSNDTPALIRTRNTNAARPSQLIYLLNSERTERSYSAGPGNISKINNARDRGMSHPAGKTRKSTTSVSNSYLG
jgi:RNA recognition motif-containing protein